MNSNFHNICRSCLIPGGAESEMIALNTVYEDIQLSDIITIITGITVKTHDYDK